MLAKERVQTGALHGPYTVVPDRGRLLITTLHSMPHRADVPGIMYRDAGHLARPPVGTKTDGHQTKYTKAKWSAHGCKGVELLYRLLPVSGWEICFGRDRD